MSKYSSSSTSSESSRSRKKRSRRRSRSSSSSSSSSSKYSSRKKTKKYKKHRRSRSRESKLKSRKHSRRSRSHSRSKSSRRRRSRSRSYRKSPGRFRRSHSNESSNGRSRYSDSRSRSQSKPDYPRLKSHDDGSALLEKLNNAAVRAMNENAKAREQNFNEPSSRDDVIDYINSNSFAPQNFSSGDKKDSLPTIYDKSEPVYKKEPPKEEVPGCLLNPNLLIDDKEEKLNRWIKKLYHIRQRTINGEPFNFM